MEKYELKESNTYYYKHHLYVVINIGKQKMENGAWEEYINKINSITKQDIIDLANRIQVNTIYFLKN